jgi:hypothetical protein
VLIGQFPPLFAITTHSTLHEVLPLFSYVSPPNED